MKIQRGVNPESRIIQITVTTPLLAEYYNNFSGMIRNNSSSISEGVNVERVNTDSAMVSFPLPSDSQMINHGDKALVSMPPDYYEKSYGSRRNSNFRDTQVDIKDNSWSVEAGLRTCQDNSSSIRYGGKDISFIRKNGHILRGGERMQVKGLFLNYKKNRRLMQYFFKIRELV